MAKVLFKKIYGFLTSKISLEVLFCFFSVLPLVIADIMLRYVVNPIYMPSFYNAVPVLFNLFWIVLINYTCRYILPSKIGRTFYVIFVTLFGIWTFANFISFKMFSRYLWLESIFLVSEASDYLTVVGQYINIKVILVVIIYVSSVLIACILWGNNTIKNRILRIIPLIASVVGIISTNAFMDISIAKDKDEGAWEVWEKPTLVYDKFVDSNKSLNISGLYQYTFKSIHKAFHKKNLVSQEYEEKVNEFFEAKKTTNINDMTGFLKDKNIIFVMMESIDYWMINDKYTPTIKFMMENGINFTNHYMPNVGMGYTFNSEFALNTGYYCPTMETSASVYTKNNFPFALGNLANLNGYVSKSFHFNSRNFYNRAAMHKQFGYSEYNSFMDFLPIEKCVQDSEAVKSDKIYEMMTDNEKFMDFVITYSAHLPYDNEDNKLIGAKENYPELIDESLDLETRNALILAHDTDEFFRILIKRLKEDDLLKDTVIVGITDHYSYGMGDGKKILELRGAKDSELLERTPFFIYSPKLKPTTVEKVTSAIDVLPTLLNLFGFEKNACYIGNDAFDNKDKGIVYFPNGNWFDGDILYKSGGIYPDDQKEYIDNMNKYVQNITDINDYVISTDYFSRLHTKIERQEV